MIVCYSGYMCILDSMKAGSPLARQENNYFPIYQCLTGPKTLTSAWHIVVLLGFFWFFFRNLQILCNLTASSTTSTVNFLAKTRAENYIPVSQNKEELFSLAEHWDTAADAGALWLACDQKERKN